MALLHSRGLRFTTIKVYLCGLAAAHRDAGLSTEWMSSPLTALTMRGIKRVQGTAATVRRKLPVTFEVLRRITPLLPTDDPDSTTIRAAMWMGTAGLLRTGEFVVDSGTKPDPVRLLTVGSIKQIQHQPPVLSVHLKASKTDPFRQEVDVPITNSTAVKTILKLLNRRATDGSNEQHRPLFLMSNGQPLTRARLLSVTRQLLASAGISTDPEVGISFRRGGATALANARVTDRVIKLAGRWRSHSYARYIDTSLPVLMAHMANL